jgi:hypothetical protein
LIRGSKDRRTTNLKEKHTSFELWTPTVVMSFHYF